ncbi:MAG: hypothetical protein ABW167_09165 [Baekduia sp.]
MALTSKTDDAAVSVDASGTASSPRPRNGGRARYIGLVGAAVLIAVLARPMVIGRTFVGWDWYPHQWFIWHQAESLKATGLPTLFAHDFSGVFVPHFAFYGGTLYALAGALTLVTGDAGSAMVILIILGFAACYAGWYWLARQCGLGVWWAHVPGALFISAPYYLAMIYANGSLHEFVAISVIPPLIASVASIVRADRLRAVPAAVLAVSTTLLTGSHNITLLWGTTMLALVAVLLLAVVPAWRRAVTLVAVLRVAGVVVPAVLVNGWFLLPDIAYQSHTLIANLDFAHEQDLIWGQTLVQPRDLFSLGRANATFDYQHMALQLPLLGVAWIVLGLVFLRSAWRTSWYRVIVFLVALMTVLVVMMRRISLIEALPRPYDLLQFSYRLETYILLAFAGAVIGVLSLLRHGTRKKAMWAWVLVPVLAWSIAGAVDQLRQRPPSGLPPVTAALPYNGSAVPPGGPDYSSSDPPLVAVDPNVAVVRFPADGERGDPAKVTVNALPGDNLQTNIITMPQLVHLDGARFVARQNLGQAVVQVSKDANPGAAVITLRAAHPWPVVGGTILSLVGLAGLALNGVAIAMGARRRRHATRTAPSTS